MEINDFDEDDKISVSVDQTLSLIDQQLTELDSQLSAMGRKVGAAVELFEKNIAQITPVLLEMKARQSGNSNTVEALELRLRDMSLRVYANYAEFWVSSLEAASNQTPSLRDEASCYSELNYSRGAITIAEKKSLDPTIVAVWKQKWVTARRKLVEEGSLQEASTDTVLAELDVSIQKLREELERQQLGLGNMAASLTIELRDNIEGLEWMGIEAARMRPLKLEFETLAKQISMDDLDQSDSELLRKIKKLVREEKKNLPN